MIGPPGFGNTMLDRFIGYHARLSEEQQYPYVSVIDCQGYPCPLLTRTDIPIKAEVSFDFPYPHLLPPQKRETDSPSLSTLCTIRLVTPKPLIYL